MGWCERGGTHAPACPPLLSLSLSTLCLCLTSWGASGPPENRSTSAPRARRAAAAKLRRWRLAATSPPLPLPDTDGRHGNRAVAGGEGGRGREEGAAPGGGQRAVGMRVVVCGGGAATGSLCREELTKLSQNNS